MAGLYTTDRLVHFCSRGCFQFCFSLLVGKRFYCFSALPKSVQALTSFVMASWILGWYGKRFVEGWASERPQSGTVSVQRRSASYSLR